jgi:hypothetical protein
VEVTTITDSFVAICGCTLAGCALAYGCAHVPPGAIVRWLVYGSCAVIATQFGWLPLLPHLSLSAGTVDQYVALALATVALKWMMETVFPWLVWYEEIEEDDETE